ncbi:MAG: glycosyltransferase family 2 protein, partial [Gaiellaceae bacterium]
MAAEAKAAGRTLDATVVIPAYNAERTVGRVVRALRGQAQAPAEIVVVDDGSTDGTA